MAAKKVVKLSRSLCKIKMKRNFHENPTKTYIRKYLCRLKEAENDDKEKSEKHFLTVLENHAHSHIT